MTYGIFSCRIQILSCSTWDLVPGIKPRSPALGVQSQPLDHRGSPPSSLVFNHRIMLIFFTAFTTSCDLYSFTHLFLAHCVRGVSSRRTGLSRVLRAWPTHAQHTFLDCTNDFSSVFKSMLCLAQLDHLGNSLVLCDSVFSSANAGNRTGVFGFQLCCKDHM